MVRNRTWRIVPLLLVLAGLLPAGLIESDRQRWKPFFLDLAPRVEVTRWLLPFATRDRTDLRTVGVLSTYAAPRLSYLRGHLHSGIDLMPRGVPVPVTVYPLASGRVCSIHLAPPQGTVVVVHRLPGGGRLYTSYKHLAETFVTLGQEVAETTPLARLFTRGETAVFGGRYDHLHLEVRSRFDDYGVASWASLSRGELDSRFLDPLVFLRSHVVRQPDGRP